MDWTPQIIITSRKNEKYNVYCNYDLYNFAKYKHIDFYFPGLKMLLI